MEKKIALIKIIMIFCLMLLIIFDSSTAAESVINSMHNCIFSVIPGMFPLLFLGIALSADLQKIRFPYLEKILHIPDHTFGLFLVGLFCGYPTGAKLLNNAVNNGSIDQENAKRMQIFCNNASPAFIIGVLSAVFSNMWLAILVWIIQIFSSLLLGILLPNSFSNNTSTFRAKPLSLGNALSESLKAMSVICGWIIIFGFILSYANTLLHYIESDIAITFLHGIFELTNGFLVLPCIYNPSLRLIIGNILLSFGGFCVFLQTYSVAPELTNRYYLAGKIMHASVSATLAAVVSFFIFPNNENIPQCIPLLLCTIMLWYMILHFNKKRVAINTTL